MHASFAAIDTRKHVLAELGCLLPQRSHTIRHEGLHIGADLLARFLCCLLPGFDYGLLFGGANQFRRHVLGQGNLKPLDVEAIVPLHLVWIRERCFNGGDQPFRVIHQLLCHLPPVLRGTLAERGILLQERFLRVPELGLQFFQLLRYLRQL